MAAYIVGMPTGKRKKHRRGERERCCWCNRILEGCTANSELRATRDHIHPRHAGGVETKWCCFKCNQMKGGMLPLEWQAFMAANPFWWTRGWQSAQRWRARQETARESSP